MTHLLVDTSVVIKWFHAEGEGGVSEARSLRAAHASGLLDAHILDLAVYEVGNVLVRALHWGPAEVANQLDDLDTIIGPGLVMTAEWRRRAAELGHAHGLSFYDASWAAVADGLDMPLVSADRRLLAAGLAESPGDIVARLKLPTEPRSKEA